MCIRDRFCSLIILVSVMTSCMCVSAVCAVRRCTPSSCYTAVSYTHLDVYKRQVIWILGDNFMQLCSSPLTVDSPAIYETLRRLFVISNLTPSGRRYGNFELRYLSFRLLDGVCCTSSWFVGAFGKSVNCGVRLFRTQVVVGLWFSFRWVESCVFDSLGWFRSAVLIRSWARPRVLGLSLIHI